MPDHSAIRPAAAIACGRDPFAMPRPTPPTMTVTRGLSGPVLRVIAADGEVTLSPVDVDALVRLARMNGMVTT